MPSEKLTRILRSRSPFTSEQIDAICEPDGWAWVYGHATPRKERLPSVCFTGFAQADKDKLSALAQDSHMSVVASVNKSLSFLCVGANAGAAKLAKAKENGITLLSRGQFEDLVETGEIPATSGGA
jgi:BRCT domain type II-containing protein